MKKTLALSLCALLTTSVASAKTTLNLLWFAGSPADLAIMEKYAKQYEASNPDINLELTFVPLNQFAQKLQLMVAGNTPPDIARVPTASIGDFAPVAYDLKKQINANDFIALQQAYMKSGSKIVAAPIDVTVTALFYNKDCFAEAKVAVPNDPARAWTWAQWKTAMQTVQKGSKCRYGLAWDFTTHRWSSTLYQAGGRYMDSSAKKWAADTSEGARAIDFFKGLVDDGVMPKSLWLSGEDSTALWKTGLTAMYMSTNGTIPTFSSIQNFKWGVAPMPRDKIRSTNPGGTFLMTFQKSKNAEEAAKFMKWFTGKDVNAAYVKDSIMLSPRKDGTGLNYGQWNDEFKIFSADLKVSPSYIGREWANPSFAKLNTFIRGEIVKVLLGQQTSKQALSNITAEGNKYTK